MSGQSLVEYALALPVFLLILFGMLDFGFAFTHHLALEYATREGARMGAALGPGDPTGVPCAQVDDQIIAAVQRVLTSPGTQANIANIREIRIYRANSAGDPTANVNVWVPPGGTRIVDGTPLLFGPQSVSWSACGRNNAANPDSLGVALTYDYEFVSPLAPLMGLFGGGSIRISDKTVMALNPSI
jgi:hypothetical protein